MVVSLCTRAVCVMLFAVIATFPDAAHGDASYSSAVDVSEFNVSLPGGSVSAPVHIGTTGSDQIQGTAWNMHGSGTGNLMDMFANSSGWSSRPGFSRAWTNPGAQEAWQLFVSNNSGAAITGDTSLTFSYDISSTVTEANESATSFFAIAVVLSENGVGNIQQLYHEIESVWDVSPGSSSQSSGGSIALAREFTIPAGFEGSISIRVASSGRATSVPESGVGLLAFAAVGVLTTVRLKLI